MNDISSDREGLGRRSITAMLWGTGGSALRILLQVASQIVLARLLGPELYGVFAVALVVVLLSSLFADVGLAYGLIQKRTVSDDDIRFVSTWQIVMGLVMTLIVIAVTPWVTRAYHEPRLYAALMCLSLGCLINATAATSGALLKRNLDFKTLNLAGVVSYTIGFFVVGIPMAWAGAGVMSLVAAYLTQAAVLGVLQYLKVRHPVRPLFWQAGAPAMLDFGGTVLATNLLNWAMNGIDRAIVGSWLSLSAAGLYATAYNLINTPLMTLLALLQSVFYSASSKIQDDKPQLRRGLAALFGAVAMFIAPVFAGIAASGETIILAFYGTQWAGGGAVLTPLALAMPAYLVMALAVPVLWASGATRKEFLLQLPIALVWVVVLWMVAQTGSLAALSWSVFTLFCVRAIVLVGATMRQIAMPPRTVVAACKPGLAIMVLVGATALVADRTFITWFTYPQPQLHLAFDIAACAIAMLAGLRLFGSWVAHDLRHLLQQLAGRIPGGHGTRLLKLMTGV
ncbi:MAG: oligosaccharide flippase family protein [Hyphomicrobiaceae bacterium]